MLPQDFSLFDIIPQIPQLLVVDIGASELEGDDTPKYSKLVEAGNAMVIGFEPNEEACDKLNQKYGREHKFYPYFIGKGGDETFYETNWFATGSLYKPNKPLLKIFQQLHEVTTLKKEHSVTTKTLDDITDALDVDYLKIDVQGAELDVFKNSPKTMANATVVNTEVEFLELYEGQPMFADVDKYLRSIGFQFHTLEGVGGRCFKPMLAKNSVSAGIKQFIWSDAVYVRDFMKLDVLSEVKLLKMAAIVHDIYQSFDLCHYVLIEYDRKSGKSAAADYRKHIVGM